MAAMMSENSVQVQKQIGNRKIYLDMVRIFAIFLVLFTHTGKSGPKLYTICSDSLKQIFYLMLDCLRTINNPLLFMVSGALLLGKNESVKTILKKRVVRFVAVLLIFSVYQSLYKKNVLNQITFQSVVQIIKDLIQSPVKSSYWYLYSYISFLVMLPFLRPIAQKLDLSQFVYLIICVVVVKDVFPLLKSEFELSKINFSIFLNGFNTFYPLLGYYLDRNWDEIRKKYSWSYLLIFGLAIAGISMAIGFTLLDHKRNMQWSETYIGLFYTPVAMAVFLAFKNLCTFLENKKVNLRGKKAKVIGFISGTTFGVYLLEEQFMRVTKDVFTVANRWLPTLLADWIWILAAMLLGSVVIGVAKKIPVIKQLL